MTAGNDFSIWMWAIPSGRPLPVRCRIHLVMILILILKGVE